MAEQQQERRMEAASKRERRRKDNMIRSDNARKGLDEQTHDVSAEDMASSAFAKALPSYPDRAPPSLSNDSSSLASDIRDSGPAVYDPSSGVYKTPQTRATLVVGKMVLPGTGVVQNAGDAGVAANALNAEEANERPAKLEETAADASRLSSRIVNAQGFTTPPPSELQKEALTASGTTRKDFPTAEETLKKLKLVPALFDRVEEKALDLMMKFGKREVAFGGKMALNITQEKPDVHLRKHDNTTASDLYLLILLDVDLSTFERSAVSSLFLQWMVCDIRVPCSDSPVDVNENGIEMVKYSDGSKCGETQGHVLMLYEVQKKMEKSAIGEIQREAFNPKEFIQSLQLEKPNPVLAFYYETFHS